MDGQGSRDELTLLEAAEVTVAAAVTAVSWAGSDGEGVLAHVATISPSMMAASRERYEIDRGGPCAHTWYDDSTGFEVAALPAMAAPMWSARVRKAIDAAAAEIRGLAGAPADQRRGVRVAVRGYALMACDLWGIYEPPVRGFQPITEAIAALTNEMLEADLQL